MPIRSKMLHGARQLKHAGFVRWKGLRRTFTRWSVFVNDHRWARAELRRPFQYIPSYYAHTFLTRTPPEAGPVMPAPPTLWVIWLGGPPNDNRRTSLDSLANQPGLEVRIITDPDQVESEGHPFHPAFKNLHVVHKSDYLRAYVMHHFGGAYVDVKPLRRDLRPTLDLLNDTPDAQLVGYREITSQYVADLPGILGAHLKRHYRAAMGPSGFIFRPRSQFTAEWMRELHDRLDYYSNALNDAEASECNPYSAPPEYPIRWSEILADITQPLSLKHQDHVIFTDDVRPVLKGYR